MHKIARSLLLAASLLLPALPAHAEGPREITVYKSPTCGCCEAWSEALEDAGYSVTRHDQDDLTPIKRQADVPDEMQACHTAMLDGYVIEGHVPLPAIDKLLAERPDIRGLAVPGMPQGSLGMGHDPDARYTVYSYTADGDAAPVPFYEAGQ